MAIQKIPNTLIADNAITATKIANGTLTADDIAANSITAAKLSASTSPTFGGLTVNSVDAVGVITGGAYGATNTAKLRLRGGYGDNTYINGFDIKATRTSAYGNGATLDFVKEARGVESGKALTITHGGDISFYENTGTTAKLFWDASEERLGIGDTSPLAKLEIAGSKYVLTDSGQAKGGIHLRPDSNSASGEYGGAISFSCGGSGSSAIAAVNEGGSDIDSNGLAFMTHSASTGSADAVEVMRLDELGNLLVGTTDDVVWNNSANSSADNGHNFRTDGRSGFSSYQATANSNATVNINRTSTDGDLIRAFKSGSLVGSIGTEGTELTIGTTTAGLQFLGSEGKIRPFNMSTNSASNGVVDLGRSNAKFKDLYLSGAIKMDSDLDDYEEGSWTPNFSDTSGNLSNAVVASSQTGSYTKIGNLVSVQGYFYQNGNDTNMSDTLLRIAGLPFTNSSTHSIGTIRTLDIFARQPTTRFTRVYLPSGANYLEVTKDNGNQNLASGTNNWEVQAAVANVNSVGANNCAVVFQITYATTT